MNKDEIDKKLEEFFHQNGERLRLPEEINGAVMVGITEFVLSLMPDYESLVEQTRRMENALITIRNMNVYLMSDNDTRKAVMADFYRRKLQDAIRYAENVLIESL